MDTFKELCFCILFKIGGTCAMEIYVIVIKKITEKKTDLQKEQNKKKLHDMLLTTEPICISCRQMWFTIHSKHL